MGTQSWIQTKLIHQSPAQGQPPTAWNDLKTQPFREDGSPHIFCEETWLPQVTLPSMQGCLTPSVHATIPLASDYGRTMGGGSYELSKITPKIALIDKAGSYI